MLCLEDIVAARARIRDFVWETPLLFSEALTRLAGRPVHLKLECWQKTGSFKPRGAFNFCLLLAAQRQGAAEAGRGGVPPQGAGQATRHAAAPARGVAAPGDATPLPGLVTASAGNHGLGAALACRTLGLALTVVVPRSAPRAKKEGIRTLGAELLEVAGGYEDAHARALELAASTGRTYIPAYEQEWIMAGQGTLALEAADSLGMGADFLVPVGGGGLMAGVGVAAKGRDRSARLVGAQSELTDAMHRALRAGRVVHIADRPTLCDGLAGDIEPLTLEYGQRLLDGLVLVSERAVARAIYFLLREHRLVVEGSGAVGVAALLDERARPLVLEALGGGAAARRPLVVVLSGRNIDVEVLGGILERPGGS